MFLHFFLGLYVTACLAPLCQAQCLLPNNIKLQPGTSRDSPTYCSRISCLNMAGDVHIEYCDRMKYDIPQDAIGIHPNMRNPKVPYPYCCQYKEL